MEGDDEDDDVLSDDMKGPVLDTKLAALCAVEAWLERVTAHVEDDASESIDVLLFRRKDRSTQNAFFYVLWKDAIAGETGGGGRRDL